MDKDISEYLDELRDPQSLATLAAFLVSIDPMINVSYSPIDIPECENIMMIPYYVVRGEYGPQRPIIVGKGGEFYSGSNDAMEILRKKMDEIVKFHNKCK